MLRRTLRRHVLWGQDMSRYVPPYTAAGLFRGCPLQRYYDSSARLTSSSSSSSPEAPTSTARKQFPESSRRAKSPLIMNTAEVTASWAPPVVVCNASEGSAARGQTLCQVTPLCREDITRILSQLVSEGEEMEGEEEGEERQAGSGGSKDDPQLQQQQQQQEHRRKAMFLSNLSKAYYTLATVCEVVSANVPLLCGAEALQTGVPVAAVKESVDLALGRLRRVADMLGEIENSPSGKQSEVEVLALLRDATTSVGFLPLDGLKGTRVICLLTPQRFSLSLMLQSLPLLLLSPFWCLHTSSSDAASFTNSKTASSHFAPVPSVLWCCHSESSLTAMWLITLLRQKTRELTVAASSAVSAASAASSSTSPHPTASNDKERSARVASVGDLRLHVALTVSPEAHLVPALAEVAKTKRGDHNEEESAELSHHSPVSLVTCGLTPEELRGLGLRPRGVFPHIPLFVSEATAVSIAAERDILHEAGENKKHPRHSEAIGKSEAATTTSSGSSSGNESSTSATEESNSNITSNSTTAIEERIAAVIARNSLFPRFPDFGFFEGISTSSSSPPSPLDSSSRFSFAFGHKRRHHCHHDSNTEQGNGGKVFPASLCLSDAEDHLLSISSSPLTQATFLSVSSSTPQTSMPCEIKETPSPPPPTCAANTSTITTAAATPLYSGGRPVLYYVSRKYIPRVLACLVRRHLSGGDSRSTQKDDRKVTAAATPWCEWKMPLDNNTNSTNATSSNNNSSGDIETDNCKDPKHLKKKQAMMNNGNVGEIWSENPSNTAAKSLTKANTNAMMMMPFRVGHALDGTATAGPCVSHAHLTSLRHCIKEAAVNGVRLSMTVTVGGKNGGNSKEKASKTNGHTPTSEKDCDGCEGSRMNSKESMPSDGSNTNTKTTTTTTLRVRWWQVCGGFPLPLTAVQGRAPYLVPCVLYLDLSEVTIPCDCPECYNIDGGNTTSSNDAGGTLSNSAAAAGQSTHTNVVGGGDVCGDVNHVTGSKSQEGTSNQPSVSTTPPTPTSHHPSSSPSALCHTPNLPCRRRAAAAESVRQLLAPLESQYGSAAATGALIFICGV